MTKIGDIYRDYRLAHKSLNRRESDWDSWFNEFNIRIKQ